MVGKDGKKNPNSHRYLHPHILLFGSHSLKTIAYLCSPKGPLNLCLRKQLGSSLVSFTGHLATKVPSMPTSFVRELRKAGRLYSQSKEIRCDGDWSFT